MEMYLREIVEKRAPTFSKLRNIQQSTVLQAMFDPTALMSGPTWLRFLAAASMVPGLAGGAAGGKTNVRLLERSFKEIFLNESEIRLISCNKPLFDKLVVLKERKDDDGVEKVF